MTSGWTGTSAARVAAIAAAVATVGCDRVTKHVATTLLAGTPPRSFLGDTVRLSYVENTGGFLSLGANLPPDVRTALFTVITGAVLLALGVLALRSGYAGWSRIGVFLFLAGGLSNWIDRVARGSVVDFLNIGVGTLRTGVFNVADVAIMIGAGTVLICELRRRRPETEAT